MDEKICAGIVLYNPDLHRLKKNINRISEQVDEIVLIDNDSRNKSDIKELVESYISVGVVWNKKNLGVAAALNQIVGIAHAKGYSWVLLLDQDSVAAEDLIDNYQRFFYKKKISIICPQIIDLNLDNAIKTGAEVLKCSTDLITSGSCIRIEDWIELGGFDERLFIDFVDTDYQERCLRSGKTIIKVNDAHLYHEVGSLMKKNFLGLKVICSNHNATRRYYMVRNRLFFKRKYFGKMSYYKELIRLLLGTFKILLFEEQKKAKIKSFIYGVRDSKDLIRDDKGKNTNKGKRISIILPSAFGSGGISVLYEYGRRLSKRGYSVTYYVPLVAYNMHKGKPSVDFIKQVYATFKMIAIYYIKHKIKQIRVEEQADIRLVLRINDKNVSDSDVVIASAWMTAFDVMHLSKRKGEKYYFIQGYEVWDNEKLGKQSYALPLKKIAIAEWIKQKLVEECGCNSDSIIVVNNGIDTNKFNNPNKNYSQQKNVKCLMLDHRLRIKGVKEGIESFQNAKKSVPNIRLTMFGMTKSKNVPEWIEYYQDPSQDKIVELYRNSDIFIFPSLEDGWGLTPIEAMACKCAVVGTNVGCMLDIGKHKENVLLSEPGDVEEMVKNLILIISDQEIRKKISEEGFKTVQKLDWEKSTDRLIKALKV